MFIRLIWNNKKYQVFQTELMNKYIYVQISGINNS